MATLPQLTEADIKVLNQVLRVFLTHTGASTALIIDKGGFLIAHQGDAEQFDITTIGALASGAFMANQTIAGLIHEADFSSTYQQGADHSMFAMNVDEHCLMVVIFGVENGVGVVKYYAQPACERIAQQLQTAWERSPGEGLDLSMANLSDPSDLFRRIQ